MPKDKDKKPDASKKVRKIAVKVRKRHSGEKLSKRDVRDRAKTIIAHRAKPIVKLSKKIQGRQEKRGDTPFSDRGARALAAKRIDKKADKKDSKKTGPDKRTRKVAKVAKKVLARQAASGSDTGGAKNARARAREIIRNRKDKK